MNKIKDFKVIILIYLTVLSGIMGVHIVEADTTETNVIISDDISITGFQISTSLIIDGKEDVGIRTIYQIEPYVNGESVTEKGLVYGLLAGDIDTSDLTVDSENDFVRHQASTENGKCLVQMGISTTADYYVMTMPIANGYNSSYYVRPYVRLDDGSVVYGECVGYNVYKIAKKLYSDRKMPNYAMHCALYDKILQNLGVDKIDYNWNGTLVNKPDIEGASLKIEGYQMTTSMGGTDGKIGLRTVYSIEDNLAEESTEVGLIYGLVYDFGEGTITRDDITIDSDKDMVVAYAATENGIIHEQMGDSNSAVYYARTMDITSMNNTGLKTTTLVRAYAKLKDGTVYYGDISEYSIYDVAVMLYENNLMRTYNGHVYLYDKVIKKVNSKNEEVDYDWSNTLTGAGDSVNVNSHKYKYYMSLEKAVEDANNMTTDNCEKNYKNAEAGLYIDAVNNKAEIILYRNTSNTEGITVEENVEMNLNEKTISFKEGAGIKHMSDLIVGNGNMTFENIDNAINSYSEEETAGELELNKVAITHTSLEDNIAPRTIVSNNVSISDCTIITHGANATSGLYLEQSKSQSNIYNTSFETTSEADNCFNVYVCNAGNIKIEGGNFNSETKSKKWSMCIYTKDQGTTAEVKDVNARAIGTQYNNVAAYNSGGCKMTISGGYYFVNPVPTNQTNHDSYGVALMNIGNMEIGGDAEAIGGNTGIQCSMGSTTIINSGTFKSPNHGGIYVACGSTGKCEINGGQFICNRGDYTDSQLGTISSFGAAYFGCASESEKWSVDIKNATFINQYGQGIVQKSNENYIPPTINLYQCMVLGKTYDLVIQNNQSVETYDAYINLYAGTTLLGGTNNDLYYLNNGKSHIMDYR